MGTNIAFSCKNKNNHKSNQSNDLIYLPTWNFQIGVGQMHSPEMIFGENDHPLIFSLLKSRKMKTEVETLLSQRYQPDNYGYSVYFCSKCMTFYERFYFRLLKGDLFYEPQYRCSSCKHLIKPVNITEINGTAKIIDFLGEELKWTCSECGYHELVIDTSICIMWD